MQYGGFLNSNIALYNRAGKLRKKMIMIVVFDD